MARNAGSLDSSNLLLLQLRSGLGLVKPSSLGELPSGTLLEGSSASDGLLIAAGSSFFDALLALRQSARAVKAKISIILPVVDKSTDNHDKSTDGH